MSLRLCRDCGEQAAGTVTNCSHCGSADLIRMSMPAAPRQELLGWGGGAAVAVKRPWLPRHGSPAAGTAVMGPPRARVASGAAAATADAATADAGGTAAIGEEAPAPGDYFLVTATKLTAMTVATLGFYQIYWFYKQWKSLAQRRQLKVSAFWRTFFAGFFLYSLGRHVQDEARELGITPNWSPASLTIVYWASFAFVWLPNLVFPLVGFLICLISPMQLQQTVLQINSARGGQVPGGYSGWNVVAIVLGSLFWLGPIAIVLIATLTG